MTSTFTQHQQLFTMFRINILIVSLHTTRANYINDEMEYETQDEWSAIERLREDNEGMPRTCRRGSAFVNLLFSNL